jgi:hypothetical protein
MPESVKAGIAKMGELLQQDRILELPARREVVERGVDASTGAMATPMATSAVPSTTKRAGGNSPSPF